MNQNLGPIPCQLQRDGAADARCRARHQRPLTFEILVRQR
jgi:hypothetical protein